MRNLANRICIMLLAVVGLGAVAPMALGADKPRKLNVLFLFSDDQRTDTIHALGNMHIRTPNLDRLVETGFLFTRNYCMGSMSGAVCLPSRAMVNSGRTLWHVPMQLTGTPTWGQTMRQAGYATFGTGKWHNGQASFARSFAFGGAAFFGGMSNHLAVPIQDLKPDGTFTKRHRGDGFSSVLFADAAIDFIKQRKGKDEPFFAYVAFTAPHDPRMPPQAYADMYDPKTLPIPKNFLPEHPFDNGDMRLRDEKLAPWPRTPDIIRKHLADYYGMITHMDAQIGRILEALEASGHRDDTIIIFASDHGLAIGSHGLLGKQNMYEHSTQCPLIFAGPGIPKGKQSDALVYLLDIFPTTCALTGVNAPSTIEGMSLAPIIAGKQAKARDSIFTAYKNVQRAVRDQRWKLIRYDVKGKQTTQLFDLQSDPDEMRNLADDPAHADQLARLTALLADWRKKLDDPVDFGAASTN